jgi:hypothetical protein
MTDRDPAGPATPPDPAFIEADAAYYRAKARQCEGMAGRSRDEAAATTLRSLAGAFETKARSLEE